MSEATGASNASHSEPAETAVVYPYVIVKSEPGSDHQQIRPGALYRYRNSEDGSTRSRGSLSSQAFKEAQYDNPEYFKMFCNLFRSQEDCRHRLTQDWSRRVMEGMSKRQTLVSDLQDDAKSVGPSASSHVLTLPKQFQDMTTINSSDLSLAKAEIGSILRALASGGSEHASSTSSAQVSQTQTPKFAYLVPSGEFKARHTRLATEEETRAMWDKKEKKYAAEGGQTVVYTAHGRFSETTDERTQKE